MIVKIYLIMQAVSREFVDVCQQGVLVNVIAFIKEHPNVYVHYQDDLVFRMACSEGHIDIVEWLLNTYPEIDVHAVKNQAIQYACYYNHLDVVKLISDRYDWDAMHVECKHVFEHSCQGGYLQMAQWLYARHRPLLDQHLVEAFIYVCADNNVEVIQWLHEICEPTLQDAQKALKRACVNNNIDVIKWIASMFPDTKISDSTFETCLMSNHFDIAMWICDSDLCTSLVTGQSKCSHDSILRACDSGRLDILRCLSSVGAHISKVDELVMSACNNDHLDILKWLFQINQHACTRNFNIHAFRVSCEHHNMDICWFLLEQSYKIDHYRIFKAMIKYDVFGVDAWMNHTYPFCLYGHDSDLFRAACASRDLGLVQAIAKAGNIIECSEDALYKACRHSDQNMANWLVATYPNLQIMDTDLENIIHNFDADIIIWALETFDIDIHSGNECIFFDIFTPWLPIIFDTLVFKNKSDSGVHYCKYDQCYLVSSNRIQRQGHAESVMCMYDGYVHHVYYVYSRNIISPDDIVHVTKYVTDSQRSCRKKSAVSC